MTIWEFMYRCGSACYNFGYNIGNALAYYLW